MSTAPTLIGEPPGRIAPARSLANTFEFEAMAQRSLSPAAFAEIAGSERSALDRITFRPRMMVNTTHLDLTTDLFGQSLFAPILVVPRAGRSGITRKANWPACAALPPPKPPWWFPAALASRSRRSPPSSPLPPSGIKSTRKRMRPLSGAVSTRPWPLGARRCASPSAARIGAPSTACGKASASRLCSRAS